MYKHILAAILAVTLVGCGGSFQVHNPQTSTASLKDPKAITIASIDQAYAVHASISATVRQNFVDKIITKEEKDSYAATLSKALSYIDTADDFVWVGNIDGANLRLKLANAIFTELQRDLAKLAAKEKH